MKIVCPVSNGQTGKEYTNMMRKMTFFLAVMMVTLFGAHALAGIQLTVTVAPPPIAPLPWRRLHLDARLLSIR